MYFSVGREGIPMTQPSREEILAVSDLATRGKANRTRQDQYVTAIFSPT